MQSMQSRVVRVVMYLCLMYLPQSGSIRLAQDSFHYSCNLGVVQLQAVLLTVGPVLK